MMDEDLRPCLCCGEFIDEGRGGDYCMSCAGLNGSIRDWNLTKRIVKRRQKVKKEQKSINDWGEPKDYIKGITT